MGADTDRQAHTEREREAEYETLVVVIVTVAFTGTVKQNAANLFGNLVNEVGLIWPRVTVVRTCKKL